MALINCPECGKEISDKAKKCPHCGYSNCTKTLAPRKRTIIVGIIVILLLLVIILCLVKLFGTKEVTRGVSWNDSMNTVENIEKEYSPMAEIKRNSDSIIVDAGHKRRLILWEGVDCTRVWYGFDEQFKLNEVVMYFQETKEVSFDTINKILIEKYGEPDSSVYSTLQKESTWIIGDTRIKFENAGREGETFTLGILREAAFKLTYSKEK